MNTIDKFKRFIEKFNCGAHQLLSRGYYLHTQDWNLKLSRSSKTFELKNPPPYYTHPLSAILEGIKISTAVYGERTNYDGYLTSAYPYLQLERMFHFHQTSSLYSAFSQGFNTNANNRNVYASGHYPEQEVAFDLGRFMLHKHCSIILPYTKRDCFK